MMVRSTPLFLVLYALHMPLYAADDEGLRQDRIGTKDRIIPNKFSNDEALKNFENNTPEWSRFGEAQFPMTENAKKIFDKVAPIDSQRDLISSLIKCVSKLKDNLEFFGPDTAVLMYTSGPRSIAMAATLIKEKGYQPVWKLPKALNDDTLAQYMLALKSYTPEFKPNIHMGAPPVFIMDSHNRSENFELPFPTSADFARNGIKKVIVITEGVSERPIEMDSEDINFMVVNTQGSPLSLYKALLEYNRNGINVFRFHVDSRVRIDPRDDYPKRLVLKMKEKMKEQKEKMKEQMKALTNK